MAEEILVKEPLTKDMIVAGDVVLHTLETAKYPLDALFWLYTSESNIWRLTIASPSVDKAGPLKSYAQLRQALAGSAVVLSPLVAFEFSIISSDDPLVSALVLLSKKSNIAGQRFSRGYFYWVYVEDIYVYFVNNSLEVFEGASIFAYTPTPEGPPRVNGRKMRNLGDKPGRANTNNGD